MPSQNTNIIGGLRGKFDPHYKLASNVEGLEKGTAIQVAQLHKTLSKSFGMQRKTLMRVLALEKQVAKLRQEQHLEKEELKRKQQKQDIGDWADEADEWESSGGASTGRYRSVGGETTDTRATATKDPGYASRVMGKDASGDYLSGAERKARFKKTKITGADIKKGSSVGGAEKIAADTTGASALAIRKPSSADVKPDDVTPTDAEAKGTESLIGPLKTIASGVNGIIETLKKSNKADKKAADDARKAAEKKTREEKEGKLEGIKDKLAGAAETVLEPVKSIFEKIWDFLKIVFLGRVVMKLFEWFTNPENGKKVASLFRFLKDWWPVLVAGIMAVVGPGMIFTAGLIALLAWGVPKIIEAVKWVGSLFGIGVDKELKAIEKESAKTGDDITDTMDKELTKDAEEITDKQAEVSDTQTGETAPTGETPAIVSETQQQAEDVQTGADKAEPLNMFAGGGQVPGSGSGDTVPAMLTPGEFVMSKGAVQQYGANTLAGMNAAAGGTNRPTLGRYQGGGSVKNVSNKNVSNRNVSNKNVSNKNVSNRIVSNKNVSNRNVISNGMSVGGPKIHYASGGLVGNIFNTSSSNNILNVPQKIIPKQTVHFAGGGAVTEEQAQIVNSSPSQIVINPPSTAASSVVTTDPVGNVNAQLASRPTPDQDLPEFSATKMRSISKIKTLGIMV